jgi:flagellar protein FlaG
MEIQNKMPNATAASMSGEGGQVLPPGGKASAQAVEIKAPPKVPDFEPKDLAKAVQDLQAYVDGLGRDLSFRRDESIDRSIITVRDSSTNQVVRQIPGEEVIAISRQIKEDLNELRSGMLMKDEV